MNLTIQEYDFVQKYKTQAVREMHTLFPQLTTKEIGYAIDDMIGKRLTDHPITIDNNYKKMQVASTLLELTQYIKEKEPIFTNQGVMFAKHGTIPNPIAKMLDSFLRDRGLMKKEMFKYPKGSPDFAKYNLLQLLLKIDANGFYGVGGQYSSVYYNVYCASATTTQGRQANATAALFFEMFMANNVPFESIEELFGFIDNVCYKDKRTFDTRSLNLRMIDQDECFFKLLYNCGFDWIPTQEELETIWKALSNLGMENWTRLYYKNNLFSFCDNPVIMDTILKVLCTLEKPFTDPNRPPAEVKDYLDFLTDVMREYVFYGHQIPSKLEKMDCLIRDVSIIQDTDSCIVTYDGWYRYILQHTMGIPMAIKTEFIDMANEEIVDRDVVLDYDFLNDDIIERDRMINPIIMIPQDGLRHSIINTLAYTTGILLNEYVEQMAANFGSHHPNGCQLYLKNEFTFRRTLLSDAKKHYATDQEVQEGNLIPAEKSLDVKGMEAFVKSTMNPNTQARLKKILYEDIMKTPVPDQVVIIKKIAILEKDIFNSIQAGKKEYYKPVKVRSASAYEKPMSIQGIKASLAYNALHEPDTEAIDTTIRNSVDIIKVDMNPKNLDKIKETFPGVYQRAMDFISGNQYYKAGIEAIAIPLNEPVPEWVLPFVRYAEIINDNVGKFPLESVGLSRGNANNNATNMVQF